MTEYFDDINRDQEEIRVGSNEEDVEYLDSGLLRIAQKRTPV